ncbi:AMP-binding protein [Halopiger goleimassiliensis]|uniref:AMP-binding protein n=1 Tax=Halopiger goleimassiliensis TaxID=1293048 RepID=UPI0006776706|nr:AMP-binding protein [Halopiger goleimassiliensis]
MTLSLARRAERFPERTAVVDISEERLYAPAETVHEDRVSYATLSQLADETAARLAALGIDAGDTVCLLTRNRVASLALVFACRRLGATLAPISHLLTPVTVERPFDALEPDLVVAEAAQRDLVRSIPFDRTVTLDDLADVDPNGDAPVDSRTGDADGSRGASVDADGPLLVLHGEGGRPLVAYDERALEYNCLTAVVAWGLSTRETVPVTSPLSAYDGLVRVALPALYVGARLLLDRAFDPGDALTAMANEDATLLAARERTIRDLPDEAGFDEAIDALERVLVDGDPDDETRTAFLERGVPVARVYGRLECPTACSQPVGVGTDENAAATDDVGPPVPDCRARLVDDGVLEGAGTGRLHLAGPVLADDYVDEPTAEEPATDDASALADRTNDQSNATADRGRFVDGWLETGQRFRRDADGAYAPVRDE